MSEINNPVSSNSGFSLIELLVAMAVASIIMAAIGSAYWIQNQTSREQQLVIDMQQSLRSAMYFLERDVMMAGYDGNPNDNIDATIITADPTEFSFEYVDNTNAVITVTYDLYDALLDGDFDIGRVQTGIPKSAIAENIQSLEFFYTLADGRQSTDPLNNLASPGNALADIRAVGISVLVHSATETRARDNATYRALSGGVLGPFNDGFRRQLVTTTIKCRNMT